MTWLFTLLCGGCDSFWSAGAASSAAGLSSLVAAMMSGQYHLQQQLLSGLACCLL